MKELEKLSRDINRQQIELEAQKRDQTEYTLLSSIRPIRGHKLWKICLKDMKIVEAEYKEETIIDFETAQHINNEKTIKDVVRTSGCIYISALNQKSALKRFNHNKGHANMPSGILDIKQF